MANQSSQTARAFTRHVAPFAPVALALAMSTAHPSQPASTSLSSSSGARPSAGIVAAKCSDVIDFRDCHSRYPTGCSAAAGYDAYLNYWKNQLIAPAGSSNPVKYFTALQDYQSLDAKIPAGLTQDNQGNYQDQLKQLGEGQLYGVIGYLYYFEHTGAESSNCDLTGPTGDPEFGNVDYHIGIGFVPPPGAAQAAAETLNAANDASREPAARRKNPPKKPPTTSGTAASALQQNSIIVEMTPHDRFQYENGIWTLENLQKAVGKQVKVVGQLLIDNEHNLPVQNCATASTATERQTCWRASVWELHPVVTFQVCLKVSCTQDSTDWVELNELQ